MGMPAAKQGDKVTATDQHLIQPPGTAPPVSTPLPFAGILDGGLSPNVNIMGVPAATQGSTATNTPPHVPVGGAFVKPPSNKATIIAGSATVTINGKPAARSGDKATTCNDPLDQPVGSVVAVGTVTIGG
jgi:uncharacterized Zn-binding protein involved in type VI secretion